MNFELQIVLNPTGPSKESFCPMLEVRATPFYRLCRGLSAWPKWKTLGGAVRWVGLCAKGAVGWANRRGRSVFGGR